MGERHHHDDQQLGWRVLRSARAVNTVVQALVQGIFIFTGRTIPFTTWHHRLPPAADGLDGARFFITDAIPISQKRCTIRGARMRASDLGASTAQAHGLSRK